MHPVSLKYASQCVGVLQFERRKKILVAYVFSVAAYRQEGAPASSERHYCRLVATLALKLLFVMYYRIKFFQAFNMFNCIPFDGIGLCLV